jgi:hypothetical protein
MREVPFTVRHALLINTRTRLKDAKKRSLPIGLLINVGTSLTYFNGLCAQSLKIFNLRK